jgi:Domain of unknown function (DUF4430)
MSSARGSAAVLALCAMAVAGCGLGPGSSSGEAELSVTRDYGEEVLAHGTEDVKESDTVLRLLDREVDVETRYGGAFVQSIDGLSGGSESGRTLDWFFYVNGIESPVGSAEYRPRGGDRIWWDYRDWTDAMRVPAVVGSFPEPFLHGFEGDEWGTEVICLTRLATCKVVVGRLAAAGIDTEMTSDLDAAPQGAIRVLVGPWKSIGSDPVAALLAQTPDRSGVFARFDGSRLTLLDQEGTEVSSYGRGAGLVAALRPGGGPPTWVVTGTDSAAVAKLAAPRVGTDLEDRYAIATTSASGATALPVAGGA